MPLKIGACCSIRIWFHPMCGILSLAFATPPYGDDATTGNRTTRPLMTLRP